MKKFKTEQEAFWAGDFGTEYIKRNQGEPAVASNIAFFVNALKNTHGISSCIEFGANIGMNVRALQLLYPPPSALAIHGIEINKQAADQLANVIGEDHVIQSSILDFQPQQQWDLVLIKGVLIHINPDELTAVYDKLVASTNRYLLVAEYYNPTPVAVPYRGHQERLFKRDFAGEIMDRHPEMTLIDYGFVYHRAPSFPQDDVTWFLMEKRI